MAVPCPACERLHFATNRADLPSHCTGCGHDLSAPVAPAASIPVQAPPPAANRSLLFAGVAVLCLAGWFLLSGVAEREKYLPVTATITAGYLEGDADNSFYVVDGKTYRTTVNRRWRLGDRFEVWYHPDAPESASESRPLGKFLAAVSFMVVGLFLVGLAVGIFGSALEKVDERMTVPLPTDADVESVPPPLR